MSDNHWVRQNILLPIAALTISFSGCTANRKPSRVESSLANMAKDVVIPIDAENKKNPLLVSEQTVKEGRELYMQSSSGWSGTLKTRPRTRRVL